MQQYIHWICDIQSWPFGEINNIFIIIFSAHLNTKKYINIDLIYKKLETKI